MKKICLILGSSLEFSPYVSNYLNLCEKDGITIVEWNRLKIKRQSNISDSIVYESKSSGHRKNYFEYRRYSQFIQKKLRSKEFDLYIVFGIQLTYFLRRMLKNKKYIIDVRDYHFMAKLVTTKSTLLKAEAIIISSYAYTGFLPKHGTVLVNHNINITRNMFKSFDEKKVKGGQKKQISISAIGANRDYKDNVKFIESFKNNTLVSLFFRGESKVNGMLKKHCSLNRIENVVFSDFYAKNQEGQFYEEADFINSVRDNSIYNNTLALPNKLYNAILNCRPLITNRGSYLAELVERYKIGFVFHDYSSLSEEFLLYYDRFDENTFLQNRRIFFEDIFLENDKFNAYILSQISE